MSYSVNEIINNGEIVKAIRVFRSKSLILLSFLIAV